VPRPQAPPVQIARWRAGDWREDRDQVAAEEPLYAFYLDRTGLGHPGREQVIASQPTRWQTVIRELTTVHGINLAGVKVIFSLMEAAVQNRLQIPESDFPELAGARHLWA